MPKTKKVSKRKARKDLAKKHDVLKPVLLPLDKIGTSVDCFGKLNDPRHPTCQKCGDIEICAIAMGQLNTIKRLALETKNPFKDIEEAEIVPPNPKEQRKEIKDKMKELNKQGKDRKEVILTLHGVYVINGWTKKKLGILYDKIIK